MINPRKGNMGVESGPSGAVGAVSAGPAVSGVASGLEGGLRGAAS